MRRAISLRKAGTWPEADARATVTLAFSDRHRPPFRLQDDDGEEVALAVPHAAPLADGDGLALDGGGWLKVLAATEDVVEAIAADPRHLARLAWQIGNRHIPAQVVDGGRLRLLADAAVIALLQDLGATVTRGRAPFQPEPGAYGHHEH